MERAYKESTFLTDRNHIIMLEAIIGTVSATTPDSLEPFEVLMSSISDGTAEEHLPIIETDGSRITVKVGSNSHPMSEEHSISLVRLLTQAREVIRVYLSLDRKPVAHLTVEKSDVPAAAYAYCNLRGFWKTEV